MSSNANKATVRHTSLRGTKPADYLSTLDNACTTATNCTQVQNAQVAKNALVDLQAKVATAKGSLTSRQALALAYQAANQTLASDLGAVQVSLFTYEVSVDGIAGGDASVINKAGLPARLPTPTVSTVEKVSVVHSKPGKHPMESIVSWPRTLGAAGYAIEVNFAPQSATATWTSIAPGTSRRRVITAPTPGAQFLARVAAFRSDGTLSDWSDSILVTAA